MGVGRSLSWWGLGFATIFLWAPVARFVTVWWFYRRLWPIARDGGAVVQRVHPLRRAAKLAVLAVFVLAGGLITIMSLVGIASGK
jgi:hypothetical protein